MQRSQSEHEITAINPHYFAIGEERGQDIQCDPIHGIVERGDQHQAIRDIEVGVTGRESLAVEENRRGHGQRGDAQAALLKDRQIFLQRFVVQLRSIFFDHGDHGV